MPEIYDFSKKQTYELNDIRIEFSRILQLYKFLISEYNFANEKEFKEKMKILKDYFKKFKRLFENSYENLFCMKNFKMKDPEVSKYIEACKEYYAFCSINYKQLQKERNKTQEQYTRAR